MLKATCAVLRDSWGEDYAKLEAVARAYGVALETLTGWVESGKVPVRRVGDASYVPLAGVKAAIVRAALA